MIDVFWQIGIALLITLYFIFRERPNPFFLFLGYAFFLFALVLSLPFKFLSVWISSNFTSESLLPEMLLFAFSIMIIEIAKYFSLKRYVKTRSFRNGILFGIGWATFESIDYLKVMFFTYVFSFFPNLVFDYSVALDGLGGSFLEFGLFFIVNLALTVLIVISIIKDNWFYVLYGVVFGIIVHIGYTYLIGVDKIVVGLFGLVYSLFIIFHYRKIK